jgi:hypothetical protein
MAENDMNIPPELQFRDVRKQSKIVVNKTQRSVLPQNGTEFTISATGQNQIVFRIPNDENSSVDFSSVWIVCDVTIENLAVADFSYNNGTFVSGTIDNLNDNDLALGAPATKKVAIACLQDSIESLISRVAIYCNGSELERLDYYQYAETMFNCHANNTNFSNSLGAGCMGMNCSVIDKSKMFLLGNKGTADADTAIPLAGNKSNTLQFAFPLRYCGLMNSRSAVPCYLMGGGQSSIEIRIYLESSQNSLIVGTLQKSAENKCLSIFSLPSTTPTIKLSNVRMNLDYIQTNEDYSSALREYLTSNSLTIPLKTYYHTQFQITNTQSGWVNTTISTQFSDISAVYLGFFKATEQNNFSYAGSDRLWFPMNTNGQSAITQARLSINGQIYPSVPIQLGKTNGSYGIQCAEAYQYLVKALSQNANLEILGSTNQPYIVTTSKVVNYVPATATAAATSVISVPLQSGKGLFYAQNKTVLNDNPDIIANPELFWDSPSQFVLGFDVSKSSYGDEYTLTGSDLSKTSGLIQVQLLVEGLPDVSYNCYVVIEHKRLLEIGMDNASIIY